MIRTWALIALLIAGALIDLARAGDRVECEPQRVTGDGRHWAYRIVDGRECWYPGRPGKPKDELFWDHETTPSARQPMDQAETEAKTERSEPPRLVAAPPEIESIQAMPEEWRATAADQLLAFTCCWPELEEPALIPQSTVNGGEPPAWPLALLPLGLYALWRIAKPRRALRAIGARDAGRVAARSITRLLRHNGRDGVRASREVSGIGVVRERPVKQDDEHLSSYRQCSTGLDESATSLFVLPINEQQHVSLASLLDAPDQIPRPGEVRLTEPRRATNRSDLYRQCQPIS
jgi:hypothetical protein